jgi:hypothetical protein
MRFARGKASKQPAVLSAIAESPTVRLAVQHARLIRELARHGEALDRESTGARA